MEYKIKNLLCQYKSGKNPVLFVDDLEINKGDIVFFLGASGVGKSTILETLGLMNNTIYPQSNTVFDFLGCSPNENMMKIWNKKESYLSNFRKKHFSFIFQSTNLFANLNAEDNALLTPILQSLKKIEAKNKVRKIFKTIFTKEWEEILDDKNIREMSGGQRQRLAFVRAIASDFTILLADEPTGNLDFANANKLIRHLIDSVKKRGTTSLIVSHDIELAVDNADKIVYIDKIENKESNNKKDHHHYGLINGENTYSREGDGWVNHASYGNNEKTILNNEFLIDFFKDKITKQNTEENE